MLVRAVEDAIAVLAGRPYGWGGGGELPLREDARVFALHRLFGRRGLSPAAERTNAAVDLLPDGTIELALTHAARPGAQLALRVPCGRVVEYCKVFAAGGATVEGVLRFGPEDDAALRRFRELIEWLATPAEPLEEIPP